MCMKWFVFQQSSTEETRLCFVWWCLVWCFSYFFSTDSRDSLSHTNLEDDERYQDTHSDYDDTDPQLVSKSDDNNVVTAFNTFVASTSKNADNIESDVDVESDDD